MKRARARSGSDLPVWIPITPPFFFFSKITRLEVGRKLGLLKLVIGLIHVSKTFQVMEYSRRQFYETRRNFQTRGSDGLPDRLPGMSLHLMDSGAFGTGACLTSPPFAEGSPPRHQMANTARQSSPSEP